MAQDAKKRQKKLQKKNAKRNQKRELVNRGSMKRVAPSLSRAKEWPLEETWITADWQKPEELVQMLVTRRGPHGHLAMGAIVIDTMCLGVKHAYARMIDQVGYDDVLSGMKKNQQMIPADLNLMAKIIRESATYAGELGFRPHRDLRQAMLVLGDVNSDACDVDIPLGGSDGKPHFIAGPHDNVDRIMRILTKKLGAGGFHSMMPIEGPLSDGRPML